MKKVNDDDNDKTHSGLYHLNEQNPLVEVVDRRNGYCLLKNHLPKDVYKIYGIVLEKDVSKNPYVEDGEEVKWMTALNADMVMRKLLGIMRYNVAQKDFL